MMLSDLYFFAPLLIVGACTGFLAGLLGLGGGMLLVPFLSFLFERIHVPEQHIIKMAIATSLATIAFTSFMSVRAHHRAGAVLWPTVLRLAPGILLGSMIGGRLAGLINGQWLALFFAAFVSLSSAQMLFDLRPKAARPLPGTAGLVSAGAGIGLMSSLVGAGGGFVTVPFLTYCQVKIHNAVASSAALGLPVALAGSIGYIWAGLHQSDLPPGTIGFIHLLSLACIVPASMVTAPLGAKTAHRMDVKRLKRIFGLLLLGLASYMVWRGLR